MATLALRLFLVFAATALPFDAAAVGPGPATAAQEDPALELRRLLDAAQTARTAGDHELARAAAVDAIDQTLKRSPRDGAIIVLLVDLGHLAYEVGELHAAVRAQEAVVDAFSRALHEDHHALQRARGNLAAMLYSLGDLRGACELQQRVVESLSRTLPEDDQGLLTARGNLAGMLAEFGDLHGARVMQQAVVEACSRTLPEDHPGLLTARTNLAKTMYELGDLRGALTLQEAVLAVLSRTLPGDDPGLQPARGNLAATKFDLGDLVGARTLVEAVVEAYSRTLSDEHPDLLTARANLAPIMLALGDLQGARTMLEAVLPVLSPSLSADHPDLLRLRQNLAVTLEALGDLHGARVLLDAVVEARARTLPEEHPDLLMARMNLAATMHTLGDLQGARSLLEAVVEALSRTLPEDHTRLLSARANLAHTLRELRDLIGAREIEEVVLEIRTRTLPDDHPDLQWARANLAATLAALGDLAAARALLETVLERQARTLSEDHPDLQQTREALARVLLLQAAQDGPEAQARREVVRERCLELLGAQCRSQTRAARTALLTSSSREAEERCARLSKGLGTHLSLAQGYGVIAPAPQIVPDAFVLSETTRGAALAAAVITRRGESMPEYALLKGAVHDAGARLATLARKGGASDDYRRALAQREEAERALAARARELLGENGVSGFDVEALSARLGGRDALVGFLRFARKSIDDALPKRTDTEELPETSVASLCAFVLRRRNGEGAADLALVPLGPLGPIDAAVRAWRDAIGAGAEREILLASRGAALAAPAAGRQADLDGDRAVPAGLALRELVWDPLLAALGDAQRVVIALDDVLHLVPLDALPLADTGELVGDRWRIETRVALWELLSDRPARQADGALVALGGAAFDSEPVPLAAQGLAALDGERTATPEVAGVLRGGGDFGPLTYAGVEAREIAALHDEVFADEGASLVLEKREASRAALEETAPRARWLHVATHGWFAPESIRSWSDEPSDSQAALAPRLSSEETMRGMSPMLLCGLALAGANLPPDAVGRVPGLITAEELSTLDLTRCELAVLSACDTAVGERRAGQGVASLQKALHMAGARSVITSLWKVPDEATRELMLDFYRRIWVEQEPKAQALWEAKRRMRDARDERGLPRHTTRDWAAWVLTGEPD